MKLSGIARPLVTAHTGCEGTHENTLVSIEAALASGADVIEIDIRTTTDGRPVLAHDPYVIDRAGRRMVIAEHSWETVRTRTAGSAKSPAQLEDVLELTASRDAALNLDLKDIGSVSMVYRMVAAHRLQDRVIFSGCDEEWARVVRGLIPEARVFLNAPSLEAFTGDGDGRDEDPRGDRTAYAREVHRLCTAASVLGCCGLNIDHASCRPSLISWAARRFLPVSVWTVDSEADMRRAVSLGASAVTTRYPRYLLQVLREYYAV